MLRRGQHHQRRAARCTVRANAGRVRAAAPLLTRCSFRIFLVYGPRRSRIFSRLNGALYMRALGNTSPLQWVLMEGGGRRLRACMLLSHLGHCLLEEGRFVCRSSAFEEERGASFTVGREAAKKHLAAEHGWRRRKRRLRYRIAGDMARVASLSIARRGGALLRRILAAAATRAGAEASAAARVAALAV